MRVPVFVRSEKSNALVGDGFLQPAPRSANLDSAFGGMQLFATEAWRAAPLLLTHSAQLIQPTVRLHRVSNPVSQSWLIMGNEKETLWFADEGLRAFWTFWTFAKAC